MVSRYPEENVYAKRSFGRIWLLHGWIFIALLVPPFLPAQPSDTLPILVENERLMRSEVGRIQKGLDTLVRTTFGSLPVSSLLLQTTDLQIRAQGPGQTAYAAFRGADPAQMAVFWQGFNLQNPLNGRVDLSLIPVVFLDNPSLEYGGSSALWGNGALTGTFHLDTQERFSIGWDLGARLSYGSFRQGLGALKIGHHGGALSSRNWLFYQAGRNNYSYQDQGMQVNRDHAGNRQWGGISENRFRIGKHQQIGLSLWYLQTEREVPESDLTLLEGNEDVVLARPLLSWAYKNGKLSVRARTGYFFERSRFSERQIDSTLNQRGEQFLGELEAKYQLQANQSLRFGLLYTWLQGKSDQYDGVGRQSRTAFFGSYDWISLDQKWKAVAGVRLELVGTGYAPFAVSLGGVGWLLPWLGISGSVYRNYSLPVLDDLFTREDLLPGLRPDWEPQSGWGGEGALLLKGGLSNLTWATSWGGFAQAANNTIVRTALGYGTRVPVAQYDAIYSGLEGKFEMHWTRRGWHASVEGSYTFIRSDLVNASPGQAGVGTTERLAPRHRLTGVITAGYGDFSVLYTHNYSDVTNRAWPVSNRLAAHNLANVSLLYQVERPSWRWEATLFFTLHNLWDADIELVESFPLPGLHVEGGIQVDITRKAVHQLRDE